MKNTHLRQWAVTLCSSVALCGTLAAQSPTPTTPQTSQPATPQTSQPATPQTSQPATPHAGQPAGHAAGDTAGQLTATGCLQSGMSGSSAAPSSSTAGAASGFVLKNAKMGGAGSMSAGPAAGATSGTPTTASPDPSNRAGGSMSGAHGAKDITLTADSSVNLAAHVGHQIMVTGKMSAAGAAMDHSAASPSSATGAGKGSFTVTKVSMISATCSTGS